MNSKTDIYTKVTDKILADLEKGVRPWMKPWDATHLAEQIARPVRHNGTPYKGVNVILLWSEADAKGYSCPMWMTFKQAQELGAHVRHGEHGTLVVYANTFTKKETLETGEDVEKEIPFLKGYTVFNVEQIEGLPDNYYYKSETVTAIEDRRSALDVFFLQTGAAIRHGGSRAFYNIGTDAVQMPPFLTFNCPESYYSTLAHEMTHWTRHPTRLDRDFGRKIWGDEGYAKEELVAELGSAFLCADLGITPEVRDDHAAYIESWLKALKDDKHFIFSAASHAQRACDFLHGLQTA